MKIHGLNKLTLLDFPGHIACTVFTGHCNMRCPFCHNAPLVLFPGTQPEISGEEFFDFLKMRQGTLEGVCVTGGEPTLAPDLAGFLGKIKAQGYLVKLDTNGTNPAMLRQIVAEGLADYIAMDIKSSLSRYAEAAGIKDFQTDAVAKSADLIMRAGIPYEFRTTVVRELHNAATFSSIGEWLHGARAYYLQALKTDGSMICSFSKTFTALTGYSAVELNGFLELLEPHFGTVGLRGIC